MPTNLISRIFIAGLLIFACIHSADAQQTAATALQKDSSASRTPRMKQYYFVMLSKGNNRTQDSTSAAKIQQGHMDNMGRLAKEGKLIVAGPFGDDGNWRGIFIFDVATKEEVEKILQTDPAISSGRLSYEIHPWWTMQNCVFK